MSISGTGTVMPAGTLAASASLPSGKFTVTIVELHPENGYDAEGKPRPSEHLEALCVYPDGWERSHQIKTVEDVLARVIGQLRGRYGAGEVKILKAPKELKSGAVIELEV
jgi:hypothetical protein